MASDANERLAIEAVLFTDIEGSSRLWEERPEQMAQALARHDTILRDAVEQHSGNVIKTTGDGVHAVFRDPLGAVTASLAMQLALVDPESTAGLPLRVRCGVHAGVIQHHDGDSYGSAVNRAARIMSSAHGGQVLISQTVAELVRGRLPSEITLLDLGAVRLRDLSGSERLFQLVHERLRRNFPALRSLEVAPNNLPQQMTAFVGRARELREVRDVLGRSRLLTLSGIGGLGKTRLSLQLAASVAGEFPDGVWFIELAPVSDERLVAHAIAAVLAVEEQPGRTLEDAIVRHVSERTLLLVLDNCEHLTDACARIARKMLQASRTAKILASSREHLNIPGESVYVVPPLSVPAGEDVSTAELLKCEAVRLFVDRAAAVQPSFRLTPSNATAIVAISQRLEGIPLAIELAAARVRALSIHDIAARVHDRYRLLVARDRTASPRQQTLRAAIDWSYDFLSGNEKALFRRLSLFRGGWTLEAAESIVCGGEVGPAEVLDLLATLVDKSLVLTPSDEGRYGMLDTVRQYAEEALEQSGEARGVGEQHAHFYLGLAESAQAGLAGPDRSRWLAQLDVERENLLRAHAEYLRRAEFVEMGYRLVSAIKLYWFMRGLLALGHRVTVEAISRPSERPHSPERCKALWAAGQICSYTGRYDEAEGHLGESLAIARHHDDRRMIAAVENYLALASLGRGDRLAAKTHCEEALRVSRESGIARETAVASNALAQLHRLDDNLAAAEPLYEEALALARDMNDSEFIAIALLGLAMVAIGRNAAERGRHLLAEVLRIAEETRSKPASQSALEVAAGLASLKQDWERAARLYGAAEAHAQRAGIQRDPADEAFLQPLLAAAREGAGQSAFSAAEACGRALDLDAAIAEVRDWLPSELETTVRAP